MFLVIIYRYVDMAADFPELKIILQNPYCLLKK